MLAPDGAGDRAGESPGVGAAGRGDRAGDGSSGPWPRWLIALVLAAGGSGLIVAVIWSDILIDRTDAVSGNVPDREVELPVDDPGATPVVDGELLECRPDGCERWHTRQVDRGPVAASGELVAYVGVDEATVFDVATGRQLWSAPAPGSERSDNGLASLIHLGQDRLLVGYGSTEDDTSRLLAYDTADGELVLDAELAALRMFFGLAWRDEVALVFGTAEPSVELPGSPRTLLLAVTGEGSVLWTIDGVSVLDLDQGPLLVRADGTLARIALWDGAARWQHPAASDTAAPGGDRLVVDRERGRVARIDSESGIELGAIEVDGVQSAVALGPWIGAVVGDDVRVYRVRSDDPAGEELFVRADAESLVGSVAVDDLLVVAWAAPGGSEVEVVVHRLDDASVVSAAAVDVNIDPRPLELRSGDDAGAATGDPTLVELVVDHGARLATIDLADEVVRITDRVPDEVQDRAVHIEWMDGLTAVRGPDPTLHLHGPDGAIEVQGDASVVSTDPLLVRGQGGLMHLERTLVDRTEPAGGEDDA